MPPASRFILGMEEQCRQIALALNTSMDYIAELTDEEKPYPRKE